MKTFKAVCVFEQFIKIGGITLVLIFQIEILNLIRKGNYIMKLSQIFSFWKSKIFKKLLRFPTSIKTFKADCVFEQLVKITPVNISGFVQMEDSLVVNKTNYFFINWKIHDFWVLKISNIWTTLRMWMKTFEANAVFQQLVKIGGQMHSSDFYLEASFDADKYQNFPKIDQKVDF